MKILEFLAKLCAIAAGVLLTTITLMTCVSVIGRNTIGKTIVGDFELTGAAAGAAIALFLPWCQMRRGNIIVDFFTAKVSERTNAWHSQSGTMMIGFPEWIIYTAMVPPLVLCVAIGLAQALRGFSERVYE